MLTGSVFEFGELGTVCVIVHLVNVRQFCTGFDYITTILTLSLNVFSVQGKDASKAAGNWLQLLWSDLRRDIYQHLFFVPSFNFPIMISPTEVPFLEVYSLLLSKTVHRCMP
jgi:hypothetical protein